MADKRRGAVKKLSENHIYWCIMAVDGNGKGLGTITCINIRFRLKIIIWGALNNNYGPGVGWIPWRSLASDRLPNFPNEILIEIFLIKFKFLFVCYVAFWFFGGM